MLTGTGTAGAYHAGVLRAVQEAGVKIDIVAGRGIGVVGAMFAAIDGSAHLWDASGAWRSAHAAGLYRWRASLRASGWTLGIALFALLLPLAALVGAALVYPVAFLLRLVGLEAGVSIVSGYVRLVGAVFEPAMLPVYLPRFVTVVLLVLLATLMATTAVSTLRARTRRRSRGALWWQFLRCATQRVSCGRLVHRWALAGHAGCRQDRSSPGIGFSGAVLRATCRQCGSTGFSRADCPRA